MLVWLSSKTPAVAGSGGAAALCAFACGLWRMKAPRPELPSVRPISSFPTSPLAVCVPVSVATSRVTFPAEDALPRSAGRGATEGAAKGCPSADIPTRAT